MLSKLPEVSDIDSFLSCALETGSHVPSVGSRRVSGTVKSAPGPLPHFHPPFQCFRCRHPTCGPRAAKGSRSPVCSFIFRATTGRWLRLLAPQGAEVRLSLGDTACPSMSLGLSHHVRREDTTFASTVFVVCGSPRSSRTSLLNLCLELSEGRVAGGGNPPQ